MALAVGSHIGPYEILAQIGAGGMGVVYKAVDTRLDRTVALKFLPPELTRDDEARQRFILEAKAASSLDHPNIYTIHEIDSTPDGQMFIAMAFYEGATLKERIERGPMPVAEALDIAIQVAQGLVEAHQAGLVHRDIKPANIMLTRTGLVKIVDFGIAKLLSVTGPTQTGTTLGTVAYMAPEQIDGDRAAPETDVWALGAVLYEMLTGEQAFDGENQWAVMNAIRARTLESPSSRRGEISAKIDHVVMRALERPRNRRYSSAAEFLAAAKACQAQITRPLGRETLRAGFWRVLRTPKVAASMLLVLFMLATIGVWIVNRQEDARWVREAVPEIRRLSEQGDYVSAYLLARRAVEMSPEDFDVQRAWDSVSFPPQSIDSEPQGADVYWRGYADPDGEWHYAGRTPVVNTRFPVAYLRWRLTKEGFSIMEAAGGLPSVVTLEPDGKGPAEMVRVPAGSLDLENGLISLGAYWMDKFEVTNAHYQAFVDAGGYSDSRYWKEPFTKDGREISFKEAMAAFVDRTGRPGPATWELGTYADGAGQLPVGGVNWYEAVAYAEFAGKSLPTVYHWVHATDTYAPSGFLSLSNFGTDRAVPVGTRQALSRFGAYDMAGNVKEWCWNAAGDKRYVLGGSWDEPSYKFMDRDAMNPFERLPTYGFRLVKEIDAADAAARAALERIYRDYASEIPAGEDVFKSFQSFYAFDAGGLSADIKTLDSRTELWRKERITFNASGDDRMIAYLYLPTKAEPPYSAVVFFPPSSALFTSSHEDVLVWVDFIIRSGRAVLFPVYNGTYERANGAASMGPNEQRDLVIQWVRELKRSVDYLETREDIDSQRLAFYGFSLGARFGPLLMALENRFITSIWLAGGLNQYANYPSVLPTRPEVDPFNFAPRMTMPVLMLNGRHDFTRPVETSQLPLLNLLGTPDKDKRHVLFDSGHIPPLLGVIKETLDWLDRYLGSCPLDQI